MSNDVIKVTVVSGRLLKVTEIKTKPSFGYSSIFLFHSNLFFVLMSKNIPQKNIVYHQLSEFYRLY